MTERLKHRIIGATVLVALFIIFIPMVIKLSDNPNHVVISNLTPPEKPSLPVVEEVAVVWESVPSLPVAQVNLDEQTVIVTEPIAEVVQSEVEVIAEEEVLGEAPVPESLGYFHEEEVYQTSEIELFATSDEILVVEDIRTESELVQPVLPEEIIPEGPVWMVQIGSFANQENAERLVNELTAQGYAVSTVSAPNSQGTLITRVIVGSEIDKVGAEHLQMELAERVNLQGIVIQSDHS